MMNIIDLVPQFCVTIFMHEIWSTKGPILTLREDFKAHTEECYKAGPILSLLIAKGSHSHNITSSPRGRGFQNDYANVIFALSNAEFDNGRGEGV